jgi:hypothetical protein
VSRRKHDDRNGGGATDFAAHLDSRHVGQPEIEDDQVWSTVRRRVYPGRTVGRLVNPRGDIAQCIAHREANLRLVVDDENEIGVGHTENRDAGCVTNRGTTRFRNEDHIMNIFGHSSARIGRVQILVFRMLSSPI